MAGRHEMVKPRATFSKQTMTTAATASAAGMLVGLSAPIAFASPDNESIDSRKAAAVALQTPAAESAEPTSLELNTVSGGEWEMQRVVVEAEAAPEPVVEEQETQADTGYEQTASNDAGTATNAEASYTEEAEPAPVYSGSSSSVANTAMAYIGSPYRWGGTTPSGWDCIGFVRYVYAQHGVHIGGYTTSVLSVGRQVPYSQAQPGDILYWPGHVAISVGGGQNVGSWNPNMGTRIGPDSWGGGTPTVIRVFG
ncbi:C40 family peptidase [Trueperella bialowiezensis]|uniref:Peptidoglycan endopeptidase RipA n=1 Tax=Trueperella bialowiezensis TaxID=312285 RepID=A0A448PDS6_9ACTO|nr:C40 family peptidase [Trueperella bialowiezensis]VEI13087.1 Peptidoglycan endopeptidase RipA precursor [Trueperella bialowiezensis]